MNDIKNVKQYIKENQISIDEIIKDKKQDMSKMCNFKYNENWIKANYNQTMSQREWKKWYSDHCGKCIYMSEICMYGEE